MNRLLTFMLLFTTLCVYGQGVQFEDLTYEQVVAKATKENKFIFVDVYTDWCKPCKRMDKEVFPNEDLGKFMNANFVSFKADGETSTGKLLARKFGVSSYPHFLFIDIRGNLVYKARGYMSAEKLMDEAKIASSPSDYNRYELYERKFNAGNRDKELLGKYLDLGYQKYKEVDERVFNAYFEQLDLMDKQDEEVLQRVAKYVPKADTRAYDLARDYYLRIKSDSTKEGSELIRSNLYDAVDRSLAEYCEKKDDSKLSDLLIKKEELLFELQPNDTLTNIKDVELTRLKFYVCAEKKEAYREGTVSFVEAFLWDDERFQQDTMGEKSIKQVTIDMADAGMLAQFANQYLKFYTQKEPLYDAEEWIKQAIKWDDRPEYHGTWAKITDALGDKAEAVNIARRALEKARKNKSDAATDLEDVLMSIVEVRSSKGVK